MNQIELIAVLPSWHYRPHSKKEMELTDAKALLAETDFKWQIGNVAVAGFIYSSLLSAPWMWFLLADKVTIADLIDFRRLSEQIPKGTMTAVDLGFPISVRFAKIYGFVETGEKLKRHGHTYTLMRKD